MKKVSIIMGSDSDLPKVEGAISTLQEYGVPFEVHIFSAHRTPKQLREYVAKARESDIGVFIAAAGKAAHLAGSIAAGTTLPVIGIPVSSPELGGMDALLSTVQMPSGVPVACVGIDAAANAALLAVQILSVSEQALAIKLDSAKARSAAKVMEKNTAIEQRYSR